jgi:hypothetical protein
VSTDGTVLLRQLPRHLRLGSDRYRMDDRFVDEENWTCVADSVCDQQAKTWTCFKRPTSMELTRAKCSNNEANRALCPESARH